MENHLDDKGLHIGDDGTRRFDTVLGFALRNTRTRDHDDRPCNSDFSEEVTRAMISVFGRLDPEAGLAILEKIQEGLEPLIGDDKWSSAARIKGKHAFLADYVKQWLQYGGPASVGAQPKNMHLEEMFALLNENPLRLKWLAPALFAHEHIRRAEANTLRWVVRTKGNQIDIEATLDFVRGFAVRSYDPSDWETKVRERRYTTIETHLNYLPRTVLNPLTGAAQDSASDLPYDMLPEERSQVVQWAIAARHPGVQALRDEPTLLFHSPDRPPSAYTRLREDFETAPEHDRRLFSRFGSDAIIAGHPAYPTPGPYLWIL